MGINKVFLKNELDCDIKVEFIYRIFSFSIFGWTKSNWRYDSYYVEKGNYQYLTFDSSNMNHVMVRIWVNGDNLYANTWFKVISGDNDVIEIKNSKIYFNKRERFNFDNWNELSSKKDRDSL